MRAILILVPPGGGETDYSLEFDLPGVPNPGDYVMVGRPAQEGTEDFIVRRCWWQLEYPLREEASGSIVTKPGEEPPTRIAGVTRSLAVECEFALGPLSSKSHKTACEMYRKRKMPLKAFDESGY